MPVVMLNPEQMQQVVREALEGTPDPKKIEVAENILTQAIIKDPDNFWLNFWLGGVKNRKGDVISAIAILNNCASMEGAKKADVYNNLGSIWRRVNHTQKAGESFEKAAQLKPLDPDILNNLGTMHINEGDPEKGEEILRKAIDVAPGRFHPHWNLSLCLLEQQKWGEGFDQYVWGLVTKDRPTKPYVDKRGRRVPWWHGQKVKTLVVYGEQGVGDETMFLSMIPDLCLFADRVLIDCHPRMANAIRRSFRNFRQVEVYDTRKVYNESPEWAFKYEIDAKAPLATVAKYLRYAEWTFAEHKHGYLKPKKSLVRQAKEMIGAKGPVIGISWVGGVQSTRKDLRSIPLRGFLPILKAFPEATFVSLQYTDHVSETTELEKQHGIKILNFPEWTITSHKRKFVVERGGEKIAEFNEKEEAKAYASHIESGEVKEERGPAFDLDRMFALIAATDVIVTVNQSNVWFGGALGHPTYTLTPSKPAWRYGQERKDTAFFSSVRQYRQIGTSWDEPVAELIHDLKEQVCLKEAS